MRSGPRRIWRIVRAAIVAIVATFGVVLAAAYVFTLTDRCREIVRAQIVAYFDRSYRGELELARIDGSIWGDLALSGMTLRYGGKEIAEFPRVVLRYSLWPILRGRIEVTRLETPGARLELEQDETGNWNVLQALSPKEPAPPAPSGGGLPLVIDPVILRDTAIRITPQGSPTYFVTGASLEARIEVLAAGANADLRSLALRVAREGIPAVTTDAALAYRGAETPATLSIRELRLHTDQSNVTLTGTVRGLASLKEMQVDGSLKVGTLAPTDVVVFVPQWSSTENVTGNVHVAGRATDLRAEVALTAADAAIDARLHGDLAAEPMRYDGMLSARGIDLAKLVAGFGIAGVVSGDARAQGTGNDFVAATADAKLDVHGLAANGWQLGDVATRAELVNRRAKTVTAVTIDGVKRADVTADADFGESQTYRATATLARLDPKRIAPQRAPIAGSLNVRATLEGRGFTPASTQAHAQLDVAPSRLGEVKLDRGSFDVRLSSGRLKIDDATLVANDAKLSAKGDLGLDTKHSGHIEYDLAVRDLRPWLVLAGQDGGGALALRGTAGGSLGNLDATGHLQATALRFGTSSIARGDVRYEARAVGDQPQGRVSAKLETVEGRVALRQASVDLTLDRQRTATAEITATDTAGRAHRVTGSARYGGEGIDATLADVTITAPDGAWHLAHPVRITQRNARLQIDDLVLASRDRTIRIDGVLAKSGRQALHLAVDRFSLETLKPLFAGLPEIAGMVGANVDVAGTAAAPRLDGWASVTALTVAGTRYEGIAATARYDAAGAALQADFRQDAAHTLSAQASLPMKLGWDPSWQSSVRGDASVVVHSSGLSVAALNAVAPRSVQNIDGELLADVTAKGPIDALQPRGTVELRRFQLTVPATGTSVAEGVVRLDFDPARIRIEQLSARSGQGSLQGGGTIPLAQGGTSPLDVWLEAKQFPAAASYRYRANVEGRLTVAGRASAPVVRGRVDVLDGTLRPDLDFLRQPPAPRDETIQIVSREASSAQPTAKASTAPLPRPSVYQNASVDVVLAVHPNTWVRHEEATIELEGEMRATKPPAGDLALAGEIHTVRGWAVLQGRRFTISRGSVAFTGGGEIDPTLDVVADYKKGDYVVHAIVSGTANHAALTLASDPQLEQADILSVLLFGKPAKDLSNSQKAGLQKQAGQMASSYAFTEVGQSVAQALGIENQGVQVEEISTERVALGSYLTEKTYVRVGQDIGNRQGQEVSVEYQFIPDWSVETSTSTIGGSGLDLIWHRRY